jgi:predicted nucleotidyltransferase
MYEHHEATIRRVADELGGDPHCLAVIVGGSVAKGWELPDSDVDIYLVVTEEEFQQRVLDLNLLYCNYDVADYPGGYVEGRYINYQFLIDVADHGSEPARAAFKRALVVYSRIPDLEALLTRIPIYPEQERDEKMLAFYSQLGMLPWLVAEAERRDDRFLLTWAASNIILYSSRLILAYNRILFPYQKWLMHEVRSAPEKPPEYLDLVNRLLTTPNKESAKAVWECIQTWRDWGVSWNTAASRFLLDSERGWRTGHPPLSEW